jgi:hypothetical protein
VRVKVFPAPDPDYPAFAVPTLRLLWSDAWALVSDDALHLWRDPRSAVSMAEAMQVPIMYLAPLAQREPLSVAMARLEASVDSEVVRGLIKRWLEEALNA